jgi:hypothetical protein
MKFNCGDKGRAYRKRIQEWHPWFAWRPVRLADHDCRWLEIVERKAWYRSSFPDWEYRSVQPVKEK